MTPVLDDPWLTVYGGDVRDVLPTLPAESVHCVVTSPPFWGLRDYGTATWEGGDPDCDHKRPLEKRNDRPLGAFHGSRDETDDSREKVYRERCGKCGAVRQDRQLGLEPTPEEYVANMVAVFREVRRVLRSDGTVWLNLGDSYAQNAGRKDADDGRAAEFARRGDERGYAKGSNFANYGARMGEARSTAVAGLKPKDLVGIPWRVALALQADGWYLRSDVIWSKPNPMPESVTDRPTKSHEYLFLLSKAPRYYYDADAVREASEDKQGRVISEGAGGSWGTVAGEGRLADWLAKEYGAPAAGRNLRSVWTIATAPYPGAHFATFPPKLVEPCIKASTSERGVCPECGAPWTRETTVEYVKSPVHGNGSVVGRHYETGANNYDGSGMPRLNKSVTTTGWRPSCAHEAEPVPATVLDIFAGSGTVGMVAQSLSRRAVLIDLNPDYLRQCLERNAAMPLGLGA